MMATPITRRIPPRTLEHVRAPEPTPQRTPLPTLPDHAALFLSLDGTLAPVARRPELARVSRETVELIRALHAKLDGALAIISSRPIPQIDVLLGPLKLPAAGVHGAQRRDAQGRMFKVAIEPPVELRRVIVDLVARFPNVWLEHKPAALALHYRAVPDAGPSCGRALREALLAHPEWSLLGGKYVWEIKPRDASKSTAIEAFLLEAPFVDRVPVFCGDDETDEDAYLTARAHGGFGLKVDGEIGVATLADFRVDTTAAFTRCLIAWVKGNN